MNLTSILQTFQENRAAQVELLDFLAKNPKIATTHVVICAGIPLTFTHHKGSDTYSKPHHCPLHEATRLTEAAAKHLAQLVHNGAGNKATAVRLDEAVACAITETSRTIRQIEASMVV